jgi:hypothetical protein
MYGGKKKLRVLIMHLGLAQLGTKVKPTPIEICQELVFK